MNKAQISEIMSELLQKELNVPEESISGSSKLIEELGLSSFDIMNLLADVEEKFGVELSLHDLRNIITFDDFVDCIEKAKP